jgi:phage FluMu protein Com
MRWIYCPNCGIVEVEDNEIPVFSYEEIKCPGCKAQLVRDWEVRIL